MQAVLSSQYNLMCKKTILIFLMLALFYIVVCIQLLPGEGSDGLNCVRFGMVTVDTDLSELLSLVLSTGREVERSSRFLDQMTDIVRKGM